MDLSAPAVDPASPGEALPLARWVEPVPDRWVLPAGGDPAAATMARESIRLAFVAMLQYLPPWQRATLLLREVAGLSTPEIAELVGTTPQSVNSALQRARATLAGLRAGAEGDAGPMGGTTPTRPLNAAQSVLLEHFVNAFESFDIDALVYLLHIDATLSLPPYTTWIQGPEGIRRWLRGPGVGCRGSRLVRTFANGSPAFGQYRPSETGQGYDPWALHVLEIRDGRISGLNAFRATDRLFPLFGLPARLDAEGKPAPLFG
ncbi:hypothetical protein GCM10027569_34790 [Flindersiella endophytica]